MRRPMTPAVLLLASCGAQLSSHPGEQDISDAGSTDTQTSDAGSDTDPLGRWSTPAPVGVAATTAVEDDVTLSPDALEMIFAVAIAGTGTKDLYYTSRTSISARWAAVTKLPFDLDSSEETPRFSGDNKTLYFATDRDADGDLDIYRVIRSTSGSTLWGQPEPVRGVNTSDTEKWFTPCGTDRYVLVRGTADSGTDLFEGTLGGGEPKPLDVLNSSATDTGAFLTQDCLTIYFASTRVTPEKIFVSHREAIGSPWTPPVPVDDFTGTGGNQEDPWLSADRRTFAFASDAGDTKDIYLSTR